MEVKPDSKASIAPPWSDGAKRIQVRSPGEAARVMSIVRAVRAVKRTECVGSQGLESPRNPVPAKARTVIGVPAGAVY